MAKVFLAISSKPATVMTLTPSRIRMSNNSLPSIVGQRLANARKQCGINQVYAAEIIGVSRPTFIAIEKGDRAAKADEITKLAKLYGVTVSAIMRSMEPCVDFHPHFRAAMEKIKPADSLQLKEAINEFNAFVENYLDLEQRMKLPMRTNYPDPVILNHYVNVTEFAEDIANRERLRLGLGNQPLSNIRNLLESELGVRIFYSKLPRVIAGLYIFADVFGGCILINSVHPPEKQRASIAHEYAHLLVDRYTAGIDYLTVTGRKPANEKFAESFAMNFLMPASSVRYRFNEVVNTTGDFSVGELVKLKHHYYVSMEAMALRLESLDLLKPGTWGQLKEKGLPLQEADAQLGFTVQASSEPQYPDRYKFLAVHAFASGELSEKELAKFLCCDIWDARQVIQTTRNSLELDSHGQLYSMQANFKVSLLSTNNKFLTGDI